jgi:hypothetical protein
MEKCMAQRLSKFVFLLVFSFGSFSHAAKFLILTDQKSKKKAESVRKTILATKPFSFMKNLKVEVRYFDRNQFACTNLAVNAIKNPTNQPASCNVSGAEKAEQLRLAERAEACRIPPEIEAKIFGEENVQKIILIKESSTRAGTALGNLVTMTTAAEDSIAIHELMHTFGYGDEYEFNNACEADRKCPGLASLKYQNLAVFKDTPPYESDTDARRLHSGMIPWYKLIKPATRITNGKNLGTPVANVIGLFRAANCNKSTTEYKVWKPGNEKTIMETTAISVIPKYYWKRIADLLGEDLKLSPWGDRLGNPGDAPIDESGTN